MVSKQALIRTKLASKVFNVIGKSVTLNSKSSPVYNSRGELESITSVPSTITVVPYNLTEKDQVYESWGNLEEGETDMAINYEVTINVEDTITMEGDTWRVKAVEKNYLPDNVVTIVRLSKDLA